LNGRCDNLTSNDFSVAYFSTPWSAYNSCFQSFSFTTRRILFSIIDLKGLETISLQLMVVPGIKKKCQGRAIPEKSVQ